MIVPAGARRSSAGAAGGGVSVEGWAVPAEDRVDAAKSLADVEGIPFFALEPGRRHEGTVPVAGLFDALAVQLPRDQTVDGQWACRESGGEESG